MTFCGFGSVERLSEFVKTFATLAVFFLIPSQHTLSPTWDGYKCFCHRKRTNHQSQQKNKEAKSINHQRKKNNTKKVNDCFNKLQPK